MSSVHHLVGQPLKNCSQESLRDLQYIFKESYVQSKFNNEINYCVHANMGYYGEYRLLLTDRCSLGCSTIQTPLLLIRDSSFSSIPLKHHYTQNGARELNTLENVQPYNMSHVPCHM